MRLDKRQDVRCSQEEKDAWVEKASRRGFSSVSEYARHLLNTDHTEVPVATLIHAGQTTVDDMLTDQLPLDTPVPVLVELDASAAVPPVLREMTRFARDCRNGTYHWRHGIGNPCAFCGGEI